jgi:hypothetical protein
MFVRRRRCARHPPELRIHVISILGKKTGLGSITRGRSGVGTMISSLVAISKQSCVGGICLGSMFLHREKFVLSYRLRTQVTGRRAGEFIITIGSSCAAPSLPAKNKYGIFSATRSFPSLCVRLQGYCSYSLQANACTSSHRAERLYRPQSRTCCPRCGFPGLHERVRVSGE